MLKADRSNPVVKRHHYFRLLDAGCPTGWPGGAAGFIEIIEGEKRETVLACFYASPFEIDYGCRQAGAILLEIPVESLTADCPQRVVQAAILLPDGRTVGNPPADADDRSIFPYN